MESAYELDAGSLAPLEKTRGFGMTLPGKWQRAGWDLACAVEELRGGVRSLSPLHGQNHRECCAFPKRTGNVDSPLMVFNNAARQ